MFVGRFLSQFYFALAQSRRLDIKKDNIDTCNQS